MKQNFWQERWETGRTAFHQSDVHPMLREHAPELVRPDDRVLVPLCGKSLDLMYLAQLARGSEGAVLGVEFIEQAVREFFTENALEYEDQGDGRFVSGNVEMYCRDFLSPGAEIADLGPVNFIYDRAALVALSDDTRETYARHVTSLAAPGALMFLVTFEYDQSKVGGPPFSIAPDIVHGLYAKHFTIEERVREAQPPLNPRFTEGGVQSVSEVAYVLRRKG
ncbi:MAG: thiopurine S-methyltransferase [bacterium]|nr:thiopurine S-methyltransferase [bacterium]